VPLTGTILACPSRRTPGAKHCGTVPLVPDTRETNGRRGGRQSLRYHPNLASQAGARANTGRIDAPALRRKPATRRTRDPVTLNDGDPGPRLHLHG
jgi:hypothetical protein